MDIRAADIVKNFPIVDDIAPRPVKSSVPGAWDGRRSALRRAGPFGVLSSKSEGPAHARPTARRLVAAGTGRLPGPAGLGHGSGDHGGAGGGPEVWGRSVGRPHLPDAAVRWRYLSDASLGQQANGLQADGGLRRRRRHARRSVLTACRTARDLVVHHSRRFDPRDRGAWRCSAQPQLTTRRSSSTRLASLLLCSVADEQGRGPVPLARACTRTCTCGTGL